MLHARPRCRGVDWDGWRTGYAKRCVQVALQKLLRWDLSVAERGSRQAVFRGGGAVGGQIAISNVAPSQAVFRGGGAVGGQIAISNAAPGHVPVKEALFELLQTFVFLRGHMPRRIDAAARRLVVLLSWLKFIRVFILRRRCSSFCRLLSF